MSKKKIVEGECSVCGNIGRLSYEHIPPRSAFNNKPIQIQNHINLFEKESFLFGKGTRLNKGLGAYTLCEPCNNNSGEWYAKDYADFANQAMTQMKTQDFTNGLLSFQFEIKPLNIIKQVMMMFFSANKGSILSSDKELVDFVMKKENLTLPEKYRIYLYYTLSSHRRMNGNFTIRTENGQNSNLSEINFLPFGFVLAIDSPPPNRFMVDISDFSKMHYNKEMKLQINAGLLSISSVFTGVYDNVDIYATHKSIN
jgi:hypothetical protein